VGSARHADLLAEAVAVEADAQRLLMTGDRAAATPLFREAARLYRGSWELAPPRSFGRLVGMLKAAVLAGQPDDAAAYVVDAVGPDPNSPTRGYAVAIAALVAGDDAAARRGVEAMAAGGEAFARAAGAIGALVDRDADRYAAALTAVVRDFESRDAHLTGVPIADTAAMLEALASPLGLAVGLASRVLPPTPGVSSAPPAVSGDGGPVITRPYRPEERHP